MLLNFNDVIYLLRSWFFPSDLGYPKLIKLLTKPHKYADFWGKIIMILD